MSPKRPNELNFEKKRQLIAEYSSGQSSQRDLADKYKVSLSTVNKTIKEKEKYLHQTADRNKKSKRVKKSKYEKINELSVKFIQTSNAIQMPISGTSIKAFASEVATRLNLDDFKASNGWQQKLNKRYDISYKAYRGEAAEVNDEIVNEWKSKIPQLIEGYEPQNIFNFDETALFYRLLPSKTFAFKDESRHGIKKSKVRVTLVVIANANGSDKSCAIIGKSVNPRAFRGKVLPLDYYHQSNSWINSEIYTKIVRKFDNKMQKMGRKVLLFVDNCRAHCSNIELKNTTIKYLPANTTSKLQRLDIIVHSE